MRKIPFAGIELTSQRVRGYMVPLSYRGDRHSEKRSRSIPKKTHSVCVFLKKNQSTPRPSEHPPVMGEKMSKRLRGIKGFFPFILDIKFVGRTSRGHTGGRSHRTFPPPSFCGASLNFFSREGFSHSFPSSTVKSNFVY